MENFANPFGTSDAARIRFNIGAASSGINTDIASVSLSYGGLRVKDSDTTNVTSIIFDANITSDRKLTIAMGDADRTLTLSTSVTLAGDVPALAKGGLISNNGTSNAAFSVGADGNIIVADSTQAAGLKWVTIASAMSGASPQFAAVGINVAAGSTGTLKISASANNQSIITATRFTDTAPTGSFIIGQNAVGGTLFSVAIDGSITTGKWAATAIDVAYGGTGIGSGTSGGIPYFSGSTTIASSAALTNHALVIGGGAGATPKTLAALTDGQLAIGSTGADPVLAGLTGADDVLITNAAGSITVGRVINTDTGAGVMIPVQWAQVATTFQTLAANTVYTWLFYLPFKHTFSTAIIRLFTVAASTTAGVGVYSADGNTKYFHGTVASTVTGVKTITLSSDTSLTLSPGWYISAINCTSATPTFLSVPVIDTNFSGVLDATTVWNGTAANAGSAGVVPATLGALTSLTAKQPCVIKYY